MADNSKIEWTEATWNPLVGCTKVSPGCDNCYAEGVVNRFAGTSKAFPSRFDVVTMRDEKMLTQPLRWQRPRRVFVNSLSDLFHADVPDTFILRVFSIMAQAQQHTFQLLTKRHARMRSVVPWIGRKLTEEGIAWPLPNVWLGVSVEDQHWADIRIPALLDTPAAVRWISAEPLLGPVDLRHWLVCRRCNGQHIFGTCEHLDGRALLAVRWPASRRSSNPPSLDWVVVGGESGKGARPMHPQWARDLRDQCAGAAVPFLFKQWGAWRHCAEAADLTIENAMRVAGTYEQWERFPVYCVRPDGTADLDRVPEPGVTASMQLVGKKAAGRELDGRTHDGYPAVAR